MRAFSGGKWIFAVLGAAAVSLACAFVGMFLARCHLVDTSDWVRHTLDVELSIAACRIHVREAQLSPPDRAALVGRARGDAERVRDLTVDNPSQQRRVKALLPLLQSFAGDAASAEHLDAGLRELEVVEAALEDVRLTALHRATRLGWLMSSTSAALTVVVLALMLVTLYRQSRSLAMTHAALGREAALLASVVDSMVDGVMAITPSWSFLHVNRAARRLLGPNFPVDALPKDWRSNLACIYEDGTEMHPRDGALARAIGGASTDDLVYRARQRDDANDAGTWVSATGRPVRDAEGKVIAGVVCLRDITEQKLQQEQLRAMSMLDELTRLNNRRGFILLAEQHARVAQRHEMPFAIVFADLNGLKRINDSLGHEAGDLMIRGTADVLRETFRESDILARLGGDEFVALLANADPSMRDTISRRVRDGLTQHNAREALAPRLSLSLGITFFDPEHPLLIPELIIEADRLMYADKRDQRVVRN